MLKDRHESASKLTQVQDNENMFEKHDIMFESLGSFKKELGLHGVGIDGNRNTRSSGVNPEESNEDPENFSGSAAGLRDVADKWKGTSKLGSKMSKPDEGAIV